MAKPLYFSFVVHNHQPVGNLPWVMEEAYETGYEPFLSVVERQEMPVVLHLSGCLLDWLEERHPEYLERVNSLVWEGRMELLTGAYYEPIASLIPEENFRGQTRKMTQYLLERFGYFPRGFWLAERVWEPHLASLLSRCQVDYTLVDGENFERAGVPERESRGFFEAEDGGQKFFVFPINQALRQGIPFEMPEKVVERLLTWAEDSPGGLVVFGDDGEKFGVWPGTHKWVYQEGWLERFFGLLGEHSEAIRPITLRDYLAQNEPLGRIHLPAGSYKEMMEWSEGDFHNFLRKYEEANDMHKRMLGVSEKVAEYAGRVQGEKALASGEVSLGDLEEAREELWKGQCNCPYWHGVFGGLYLPHLRRETYSHLVAAEELVGKRFTLSEAERSEPGKQCETEVRDVDGDGRDEISAYNGALRLFFRPSKGGSLYELDYLPGRENLLATLRRRREKYHEGGIAEDWYGKGCFLDHFLREDVNLEGFSRCAYSEQGDFVDQPYEYQSRQAEGGKELSVGLSRRGNVWVGNELLPFGVSKEVLLEYGEGEIGANYRLENLAGRDLEVWFGVEMNFLLSGHGMPERYYEFQSSRRSDYGGVGEEGVRLPLDARGGRERASKIALCDEWERIKVEVGCSPAGGLWFFPILTVSQSVEGLQGTYQGSSLLFHWRIGLKPEETWEGELRVGVWPLSPSGGCVLRTAIPAAKPFRDRGPGA